MYDWAGNFLQSQKLPGLEKYPERSPRAVPETGLVYRGGVFCRRRALIGIEGTMGVGVSHGWEPMCGPLVANHTTGNIMIELNLQPALSIYRQLLKEKAGTKYWTRTFLNFRILKL